MKLSDIVYNSLMLGAAGIEPVVPFFNNKYKSRIEYFKNHNIFEEIKPKFLPVIWIHAASMGEFEQAKPIIEYIKSIKPEIYITVTFFSPSGYTSQQNYPYADKIAYLPLDSTLNAKKFIDALKPDVAVFVRYEIWKNYLNELQRQKIPVFLVNAHYPASKGRFIFENFYKSAYNIFNKIITVGEEHSKYFKALTSKDKVYTLTDTRIDRIIDKVEEAKNRSLLPREYFEGFFNIILGSSWEPDEEIFIEAVERINNQNLKLIIVPHEPGEAHIKRLKSSINQSVKLSELLKLKNDNFMDELKKQISDNHIIVDSVGNLLNLYSLADIAYVGGGFGAGTHSVAEPAGYGLPLAAGPKHNNQSDCIKLKEKNLLTVINDSENAMLWIMSLYNDHEKLAEINKNTSDYILSQKGSAIKTAEILLNAIQ